MKSIGIIGCGRAAQVRHIPEYVDYRGARLDAFYDPNPEKVRGLTDTYGGRVYETYEELLEDEKTDAVSTCAPNELHVKISIAALKAGKDILCEKPMAITLGECRQTAEAAEKTGQCLMIGQNQRLAKGHALVRKLIERGDIGKVITFKTTFGHGGPESWSINSGNNTQPFDKKKAAMGAMVDLGIHKTDLIQYLMGEYVAEAIAMITTLDEKDGSGNLTGADDNAIRIYKMESGAVGTMTVSWTYYGQEGNPTILYGFKGIMRIHEDPEYCIKIIKPDNEAILYNVDQIQINGKQIKSGVTGAFMDCIVHGRETQLNGKSVPGAMEAVFVNTESAKTRKTIRIGQGE